MKQLLIAAALTLGCAASPAAAPAQMMHAAPPMTAAEFFAARSGTKASLVVRVITRSRTSLRGELLERTADKAYASSGKRVEIYVARDTPVAMGTSEDLRAGAVVVVDGVVTGPGRADAKQLVPITRYAKIAPRAT